MHKIYGWLPDIPDQRDYLYSAIKPRVRLPSKVDLRESCSQVEYQGRLGSCHDDKTEVLTDKGWVLFKNVTEKDKLATVNQLEKKVYFVVPERLTSFNYSGDLFLCESTGKDFAVTPDHKMLVRKWEENKRKLSSEYRLVAMKDVGWYSGLMSGVTTANKDIATIDLKGVEHNRKAYRANIQVSANVFLQLLGIYLAEGSMCKDKGHYKIQISASKKREKYFVLNLLKSLRIPPCVLRDRITFDDKRIFRMFEEYGLFGVRAPDKFVPEFVFLLGKSNICAFLEGFFNGDGCEQKGTISYYTSSKRLADDLHRLIILSGQWGTLNSRPARKSLTKDGRIISGKHPEYRISQWKSLQYSIERKKEVKTIKYSGFVYCAEVSPYHTLITRRSGRVLISGNCTACALVGNLEFLDNRPDATYTDVSRLFIYYNERLLRGNEDYDSGASLRDGIKTLKKTGYCWEKAWPYDIERFTQKPPQRCYNEAGKHRIASYHRIHTLAEMLACLAEGYPFVFGFAVYESFQSKKVERTGIVNMPKKNERVIGGHAVTAVGYNQKERRFLIRNSWGLKWGQAGYFTMPFAYLETQAADFWTIRK